MPHHYKLGTVAPDDVDQAALFVGDEIYELDALVEALEDAPSPQRTTSPLSVLEIVRDWTTWEPRLQALADAVVAGHPAAKPLPPQSSLRPPVTRPGTVLGAGANYRDHLEEMGVVEAPSRTYLFLKPAASTQAGDREPLFAPRHLEWIDWEAELAVIIGRRASNVSAADAPSVIAGYTVANDVSARDALASTVPLLGVDWLEHKGYDGFTPIGPAMTPAAFVPDPQNLAITLSVNGVLKQDSNTAHMVAGVYDIIERATAVLTLHPGDIVLTGTPAGVGFARSPRENLAPGDVVTVTIEGLGTIETPIV